MQAEKAIEQYLTRCVKDCYGMCIKLANTGYNGIPDRIVLKPNGVAVFVELKAPMGRVSKVQEARHRQLKNMGYTVYVLWNFEQVDWFMRKEFNV